MVKVRVSPQVKQVKVTCKQITPKLIIESIDKRTLNNLKKSIDKYYLAIEIIDSYKGEIDKDGCAVDTNDYKAWVKNHPNKISKQSVNNIIKSIKNNSLVKWIVGNMQDVGYRYAETYGSDKFNIALLDIDLAQFGKAQMHVTMIRIMFDNNNVLFTDEIQGDFISQ